MSRFWPALVAVLALGWMAFIFDWPVVLAALAEIRPCPLLPVIALLGLGIYCCCALRWIAINQLPWRLDVFRDVQAYVAVTIAIGIATPMQAGEALKLKFARDAGLPLGASAVNLALERLIDLAILVGFTIGGLVHMFRYPVWLAVMAALVPFLAGLALPDLGQRWARAWPRLARWVGAPLTASALAIVAFASLGKWIFTLASWLAVLGAVGPMPDVGQAMLLIGAVTTVSILSAVPAGLGVQELSARALLTAMDRTPAEAEIGALALRLLLPMMLAVGFAHVPLLWRRRSPHG